jgi:hypothetical protein
MWFWRPDGLTLNSSGFSICMPGTADPRSCASRSSSTVQTAVLGSLLPGLDPPSTVARPWRRVPVLLSRTSASVAAEYPIG